MTLKSIVVIIYAMTPKMQNTKMVAAYCRVSTFDQEKGLKSQEKSLQDYCDNHGFTNLIWYRDRITGSTADRTDTDTRYDTSDTRDSHRILAK